MGTDTQFTEAKKFERELISTSSTEYVKGFSFWPEPDAREGPNIYDVRSYQLRPGKFQINSLEIGLARRSVIQFNVMNPVKFLLTCS